MWLLCQTKAVPGNLPYQLKTGIHLLGRSTRCDVIVVNNSVSSRHARFSCHSSTSVVLEDLSSKNGTFVGKKRIGRSQLIPPCTFRCGSVILRIVANRPLLRGRRRVPAKALTALTEAKRKVLSLLLQGKPEKQIARRLRRSNHTIHNHIRAIYKTFGVHSHSELLAKLLGRS
jgi:DNA-binding CsgD family transcriptional regulator